MIAGLKKIAKSEINKRPALKHWMAQLPGFKKYASMDVFYAVRRDIGQQFLRGAGLEIGALHAPLQIPPEATVQYVDRMSAADLKTHYPELAALPLVEVDIIDDGEALQSQAADSADFIIANHMIEHCENPIATLENWLRVLKPGGVLYLAVPDKRYCFDRDRPLTPIAHLVQDYEQGGEHSRESHYAEWVRLVDRTPEANFADRLQQLMAMRYSIHFHVWTPDSFVAFLDYCRTQLQLPFTLELKQQNDIELITILRKTAIAPSHVG